LGIDSSGDSTVTSDCINLAAPPYVCVNIMYAVSGGTSQAVTWENTNDADVKAVAIGFSGTEYPIVNVTRGDPVKLANAIASVTPPGLIKVVGSSTLNPVGVRYKAQVFLRVPQTIVSSLFIKFQVTDYNPVEVYAQLCSTCCDDTPTHGFPGGL
jgi:hypothetical protein